MNAIATKARKDKARGSRRTAPNLPKLISQTVFLAFCSLTYADNLGIETPELPFNILAPGIGVPEPTEGTNSVLINDDLPTGNFSAATDQQYLGRLKFSEKFFGLKSMGGKSDTWITSCDINLSLSGSAIIGDGSCQNQPGHCTLPERKFTAKVDVGASSVVKLTLTQTDDRAFCASPNDGTRTATKGYSQAYDFDVSQAPLVSLIPNSCGLSVNSKCVPLSQVSVSASFVPKINGTSVLDKMGGKPDGFFAQYITNLARTQGSYESQALNLLQGIGKLEISVENVVGADTKVELNDFSKTLITWSLLADQIDSSRDSRQLFSQNHNKLTSATQASIAQLVNPPYLDFNNSLSTVNNFGLIDYKYGFETANGASWSIVGNIAKETFFDSVNGLADTLQTTPTLAKWVATLTPLKKASVIYTELKAIYGASKAAQEIENWNDGLTFLTRLGATSYATVNFLSKWYKSFADFSKNADDSGSLYYAAEFQKDLSELGSKLYELDEMGSKIYKANKPSESVAVFADIAQFVTSGILSYKSFQGAKNYGDTLAFAPVDSLTRKFVIQVATNDAMSKVVDSAVAAASIIGRIYPGANNAIDVGKDLAEVAKPFIKGQMRLQVGELIRTQSRQAGQIPLLASAANKLGAALSSHASALEKFCDEKCVQTFDAKAKEGNTIGVIQPSAQYFGTKADVYIMARAIGFGGITQTWFKSSLGWSRDNIAPYVSSATLGSSNTYTILTPSERVANFGLDTVKAAFGSDLGYRVDIYLGFVPTLTKNIVWNRVPVYTAKAF